MRLAFAHRLDPVARTRARSTRSTIVLRRWLLVVDLWSVRALVWLARLGRDADLTPETHVFADRYRRLADFRRRRGRWTGLAPASRPRPRNTCLHTRSERAAVHGGMAMPRPRTYLTTDAVSRVQVQPARRCGVSGAVAPTIALAEMTVSRIRTVCEATARNRESVQATMLFRIFSRTSATPFEPCATTPASPPSRS